MPEGSRSRPEAVPGKRKKRQRASRERLRRKRTPVWAGLFLENPTLGIPKRKPARRQAATRRSRPVERPAREP